MRKLIITAVVILSTGIAVFLGARYLMINTRDSVVDQQEYLGNRSNSAEIYSGPSKGLLYSPLNVALVPMDKLMLIDVEDDPEYRTIELQTFDDARGRGARVLLYHHQGPADSYYTDKAFVIEEAEHDAYYPAPDMNYHLEVTASGLDASLRMRDREGKLIEFRVKEAPREKWSKGFLAPVGGSDAITFQHFPLYHMKDMNFASRSGSEVAVRIGGEERRPAKLPVPVDGEFVYLIRYTAAPIIGCWNKPHDGTVQPLRPERPVYQDGRTRYELVDNAGHYEIRRLLGSDDRHEVSFDFSPPIPDLPGLKDGTEVKGRFCAGADGTSGIVAGEYGIRRRGNRIDMEIRPLEGWQPMPGTTWVRSWIWKGTMAVGADNTVSMKSKWFRKK